MPVEISLNKKGLYFNSSKHRADLWSMSPLPVCVCMCVYACMYACVYTYTYIHTYIYIYIYIYICQPQPHPQNDWASTHFGLSWYSFRHISHTYYMCSSKMFHTNLVYNGNVFAKQTKPVVWHISALFEKKPPPQKKKRINKYIKNGYNKNPHFDLFLFKKMIKI